MWVFVGLLQPCDVARQACGGARFRGHEARTPRHFVRLIPLACVIGVELPAVRDGLHNAGDAVSNGGSVAGAGVFDAVAALARAAYGA